jgi:hypothetical protein
MWPYETERDTLPGATVGFAVALLVFSLGTPMPDWLDAAGGVTMAAMLVVMAWRWIATMPRQA